jgi:hypothetical protein
MNQDKMFIVFREQHTSEYVNGAYISTPKASFAYGAVYNPLSPKCEAKNKAQVDWCGFRYINGIYERFLKWDIGYRTRIYEPVPNNLLPRVIDNIPLTGFKIVDTVSRSSTGNKLWRILDPRDFEFEISTAIMEEIIMSCIIDKGVIMDTCIWDFGKVGIGKAHLKRL